MKNKFHNQIIITNYITSTERFKLLFVIGIFIAFYGSVILGIGNDNFIDSAFIAFQFPIYNIIVFAIIFFNTLNTCSVFEKKFNFYIIRLKNKKNYCNEMIKNVVAINLYYLILFFILFFAFLLLFKVNNIEIHNYMNYSMNNFVYLIYYLIRYILLALLISIVSALIYLNYKTLITMLFNFIFLLGFMVFPAKLIPKENIDINIWSFFSSETFENFTLDIASTLALIIFIQIIIILVYNLTIKNKKMVIS